MAVSSSARSSVSRVATRLAAGVEAEYRLGASDGKSDSQIAPRSARLMLSRVPGCAEIKNVLQQTFSAATLGDTHPFRKIRDAMSSKKTQHVFRVAWFDEQQWQLLCSLVPDRNALDASYEQWQVSAERAVREIQASGHTVERVSVDVVALSEWCRERHLPMNGSARAEYVALVAPEA